MDATIFKKVNCSFNGKVYEIRVNKDHNGFSVTTYLDDQPAFSHGYYCDNEANENYKKTFGQMGWQRLITCCKADITGKQIYRNHQVPVSS